MTDTTPPTGSVLINKGAASTSATAVTLQLSAADAGGSGIAAMRFSNGGGSATSGWERYRDVKAWSLTGGAGTRSVSVQFRDKAGNVSDAEPPRRAPSGMETRSS